MLELSKCIVYSKTRNGKECKITEFVSNVSFGIFLVQWSVTGSTALMITILPLHNFFNS